MTPATSLKQRVESRFPIPANSPRGGIVYVLQLACNHTVERRSSAKGATVMRVDCDKCSQK